MFTIVPFQEINLIIDYAGIFGLQPWAFLIIVIIVMAGGMYLYNLLYSKMRYDKNLKLVTMPDGKTLRMNGIFITATGHSYERLCDIDMHEVAIKNDKSIKRANGVMFAPKVTTQRIPQYYIHPDFVHSVMWPKNTKANQQISISQAIYRENYPLPAFSYKDMSDTERTEMTSILAGLSADQNVANAVVTEIQQKFDAFTKAVKQLGNLKLVVILVVVNIVVSGACVLMAFQSYNLLNVLRVFLGLK